VGHGIHQGRFAHARILTGLLSAASAVRHHALAVTAEMEFLLGHGRGRGVGGWTQLVRGVSRGRATARANGRRSITIFHNRL
jgi:hypothetical protein